MFTHLFQPGIIGRMEVRNRVVMSPMGTLSHGPEGEILEKTVNYYAERARGGVGFIICQSSIILRESRAPNRPSSYDDAFIPGLKMVADAIHGYGAKAAFQVIHHGRLLADYQGMVKNPEEIRVLAPSPIPRLLGVDASRETREGQDGTLWVRGNAPPPEATKEDLKRIIQGFAGAAQRIQRAGFDAVEIHGAHGYFISQFLSPLVNRRTDDYGGSPEKRARLACEIIQAVREKVGPDFPILLRISGSDFMPGGISLEETKKQAPLFVEAGVDALDVSASEQGSIDWQYPSFLFPSGPLVFLAEEIKKVVRVPVIAVGKIFDPRQADQILASGRADFVALGRALLADHHWADKAKEGREHKIRPCIYCVNCFHFGAHPEILKEGLHCTANPALLREKEFTLKKAARSKKVMVVGGGPAGMEAARTLAERGHRVILYEQGGRLGGQWEIACRQPQKKQDYPRLLEFLKKGLQEAKVEIRLHAQVTEETVKAEKPEAVVLATGAAPFIPNIAGAKGKNVVHAHEVILGQSQTGKRVVVIGGRALGMEISDQLADEGRKVMLVTRRNLGRDAERNIYLTLRNRLLQKGVYLYPHCPVMEIRENGIYIAFQNDLVFLEADTVVLATGVKAQNELGRKIKSLVKEFYQIGDCVAPRDALSAIREGAEVGRAI